jgi:hypothetical protein
MSKLPSGVKLSLVADNLSFLGRVLRRSVLPEALSLVYQSAPKAVARLYHMLRLQVERTH